MKLHQVFFLTALIAVLSQHGALAAQAKIERRDGAPTIVVDGKAIPPMMMTMTEYDIYDHDRAYIRKLGESGLKVFFMVCRTDWLLPPDPAKNEPGGVARAKAAMKLILEEVPDAYLVYRLVVSPPVDWVNAHPEEQILYSDGSHRPTTCTTCSRLPTTPSVKVDGMFSLSSEKWRVRAEAEIASFLGEMKKTQEYERVIGIFLGAGATSEWAHSQVLFTADGAYGDFSEPFRTEYEKFLRKKYGTCENLRKAWRRPDATFEKPLIPTREEREYELGVDELISLALVHRDGLIARDLPKFDKDAKGPYNLGTFLNVDQCLHVEDFFLAWNEAIANTILRFARVTKKTDPRLLVGAFYGGLGGCNYHDGGTLTGTLKLIDSPDIDFLANPGTYNNREPGGAEALRTLYDSYFLRDKLFVNEDDNRTYRAEDLEGWRKWGYFDVEDSIGALKRCFGATLASGVHAWWFDQGGNHWNVTNKPSAYYYDDPKIFRLFAAQQEIAREAYTRDRTKHSEIAFIVDMESIPVTSRFHNRTVLDYYRVTDIPRIGAPADFYFLDDIANPKMPDYKLYVMLNDYWLTEAERTAIWAKAKKNGAAILWVYAPGFIDPNADRRMSAENISKTIGMTVKMEEKTFVPYFSVNRRSHPLLARATNGRRYGVLDREVRFNLRHSDIIPPRYVNPTFYVDDPSATTLGEFCADRRTALAVKEIDGVKSIYCAGMVVRSDLLASIAEGVGCHIYTTRDDIFYANDNYVTIHATGDGLRTIRFKKRCSPYEVYEKRCYAKNVEELTVEMKHGETLTFDISPEVTRGE